MHMIIFYHAYTETWNFYCAVISSQHKIFGKISKRTLRKTSTQIHNLRRFALAHVIISTDKLSLVWLLLPWWSCKSSVSGNPSSSRWQASERTRQNLCDWSQWQSCRWTRRLRTETSLVGTALSANSTGSTNSTDKVQLMVQNHGVLIPFWTT